MAKDEPPNREDCGLPFIVKHILTEYYLYEHKRTNLNLTEMLDATQLDQNIKILKFIKLTNLIDKM